MKEQRSMTRRKFENHKAIQVNPSLVIRTRLHLETDYSRKKPDIYLDRVSDVGTKEASNANSFRYLHRYPIAKGFSYSSHGRNFHVK